MKKYTSLVIFFLFHALITNAQNYFGFSSPDNKFLGGVSMNNSEISVDKFTGRLLVNIPLTALTSKNFTIPVSINYNGGGGIKHQEYASSVGLGWQLLAGGAVSRVVRALPDDHVNGYLGPGQHGKAIKTAILNNSSLHLKYFNAFNDNFQYQNQVYDSEPDLYNVSTPHFSFTFSIDENGNAVMSGNHNYKITTQSFVNNTSSFAQSSFQVIDGNGNTYLFGTSIDHKSDIKEDLAGQSISYISSWHLSKIISADKLDTIYYDYTKFGGASQREKYNYHNWEYTRIWGFTNENLSHIVHTQEMNNKYISQIKSNMGRILFAYTNDRLDVEGGSPRLTSIIKYVKHSFGEMLDKKLVFNSSYFGSTSSPPNGEKVSDRCKLRLNNINIYFSSDDVKGRLYKGFEYNNTGSSFNRIDNATDYFGYKTSFSSGQDPMKNPSIRKAHSLSLASTFVLREIKEFSGAYNSFLYDLNTIHESSSNPKSILGGLRVAEVISREGGGASSSTNYIYEFEAKSSGTVYGSNYNQLSFVANNGQFNIEKTLSSSISNISDLNGYFINYEKVREVQHNGAYSDTYFQDYKLFPDKSTVYQSSTNVFIGGGLSGSSINYSYKRGLISKQVLYDKNNKKTNETLYTYASLDAAETKQSYGFISRTLAASINGQMGATSYNFVYYTPFENYRLTKIVNKSFDKDSNEMTNETIYTYHPNKHQIRSVANVNSEGKTVTKTLYYPADGSTIPMSTATELTVLNNFVTKNIKDIVVHEVTSTTNNTDPILHTHNIYSNNINLVETSVHKQIGSSTPVKISAVKNYYDIKNRLSMTTSNDINFKSYAYDDFNRVVAEITNAQAQKISGSSNNSNYEFYYNAYDNYFELWNPFGDNRENHAPKPTLYVPFQIENTRKYVIDYIYFNGIDEKWTYKKQRYSGPMSITDGLRIDNIRVYPEDASIQNYQYDSKGLKTLETNTFGITNRYQYDKYERLSYIKDQDNNIIKSYHYNEKEDSPEIFSNVFGNDEQKQDFFKQGCITGFVGEKITYTVPKNQYSSNISKADANQKALNDINANGQAYANTNGQCLAEGTYVSICQSSSRVETSGNYRYNYGTYVIQVWKDPEGRYLKQSPVNVKWSNGTNIINTTITGSYDVGEILLYEEYIGPPPGGGLQYPVSPLIMPEIMYQPESYEIIQKFECSPVLDLEDSEPGTGLMMTSGQINEVWRFGTKAALCNYIGLEPIPYMQIFYLNNPAAEQKCFISQNSITPPPDGYYTVARPLTQGEPVNYYYYKIVEGIIEEEGYCN